MLIRGGRLAESELEMKDLIEKGQALGQHLPEPGPLRYRAKKTDEALEWLRKGVARIPAVGRAAPPPGAAAAGDQAVRRRPRPSCARPWPWSRASSTPTWPSASRSTAQGRKEEAQGRLREGEAAGPGLAGGRRGGRGPGARDALAPAALPYAVSSAALSSDGRAAAARSTAGATAPGR